MSRCTQSHCCRCCALAAVQAAPIQPYVRPLLAPAVVQLHTLRAVLLARYSKVALTPRLPLANALPHVPLQVLTRNDYELVSPGLLAYLAYAYLGCFLPLCDRTVRVAPVNHTHTSPPSCAGDPGQQGSGVHFGGLPGGAGQGAARKMHLSAAASAQCEHRCLAWPGLSGLLAEVVLLVCACPAGVSGWGMGYER